MSAPAQTTESTRPIRFADSARNVAYWARISRLVDAAPSLTSEQRAAVRTAFHQS